MNLNITVVVQAINFFVAYWMMRILLLKPALHVIQGEQEEQKKLNTVIKQQEQSIAIKEDKRQEYWQSCRYYFSKNRPRIDDKERISKKIPEIAMPVVSQELVNNLADETQQLLVQKIGHIGE